MNREERRWLVVRFGDMNWIGRQQYFFITDVELQSHVVVESKLMMLEAMAIRDQLNGVLEVMES